MSSEQYGSSNLYTDQPSTASSSANTIRPRNRRLISTELTNTSNSPDGSRPNSPIPRTRLSRTGTNSPARGANGKLAVPGSAESPTAAFGRGLWEGNWTGSWTALQGLASSVLGGELSGDDSQDARGIRKDGKGLVKGRSVSANPQKTSKAWGPEGLPRKRDDIGVGSQASREAAVRTRKMVGVLENGEGSSAGLDVNGKYKRRTSMDETVARNEDEDGDALVYVHHVQPNDTLAGVVLKYNCQTAVFKKANRLWSNDGIQFKKVVLLPVDACGVRGRPCDPPSKDNPGVDLLATTPGIEDPPETPKLNDTDPWGRKHEESAAESSSQSVTKSEDGDQPWTHVRWVLLSSSPHSQPTEIARLPRRTLGYFPPRRRKSNNTLSTASTPRGSFDHSTNSAGPASTSSTPPRRISSSLGARPSIGTYFPAGKAKGHHRRDSVEADAARLSWMRGPGGVGSLTGKNVRIGPSQDPLNTWASKHLPGIAMDKVPSASAAGTDAPNIGFGFGEELARIDEAPMGTRTPGTMDSGDGLGLENAAAAIEGWVRRLAVKPGTPRANAGGPLITAEGDLIELLDGASSDDGRGFEPNFGEVARSIPASGLGSGREDLEGVVRGRVRAWSGNGAGKAKKSE